MSNKQEEISKYATDMQSLIMECDHEPIRGWVIDLRENEGGNIWTMVLGLAPFFQQGKIGAFIYPDGTQKNWLLKAEEILVEEMIMTRVLKPCYQLKNPYPHIAVLMGPKTTSAAEAVIVALKSCPNTCFFGQSSRGLTTSNALHHLKGGAALFLAEAFFADIYDRIYESQIDPDVIVVDQSAEVDETLYQAICWIQNKNQD